ncbi:BPSL0067 family protein [Paraburkholderia acidisoli]|uniref:BPSL0067 family protein n=1 Tax=Paraburkholderia acidisoli TaxID=2571748 RepID=A0A7Z2GMZ4_9BURK|nr:BPSL0067 family protein [Paraburkholderia acidisoli]QGZ64369.1 BPSL0067 family protein [Paraburkholderia acidisoli]
MPYVSSNYSSNPNARLGTWVCTRTSHLGPYEVAPVEHSHSPDFCGQCVSYVVQVCPTLPARTIDWKRGALVKGNAAIVPGTVIATFDAPEDTTKTPVYRGHAAIYVRQTAAGIEVYDQFVSGATPSPVSLRTIYWNGGSYISNNANNFYVVE